MLDSTRQIEAIAAQLADAAGALRAHLSDQEQAGVAFAAAVGVDSLVAELQRALTGAGALD